MVHRAVDRDILSGLWVTLLELVPGSSIMSCLLPCKAWPVDMFMCMRILYIGAPLQRRRSAIAATSARRRSKVAAPSQRHRPDIGPTSERVAAPSARRRSDVAATSTRHRPDVAAPSQRHRPNIGPTSERRRSAIAATSARRRCDMSGMPFSATIASRSRDRGYHAYDHSELFPHNIIMDAQKRTNYMSGVVSLPFFLTL